MVFLTLTMKKVRKSDYTNIITSCTNVKLLEVKQNPKFNISEYKAEVGVIGILNLEHEIYLPILRNFQIVLRMKRVK